MKIIYAQKSAGIDEDGVFQNPRYFERPDTDVTAVVIYGNYPDIETAYRGLGIPVDVRQLLKPKLTTLTANVKVGMTPELQAVLDGIKAECESVTAHNKVLQGQLDQALANLEAERTIHVTFKHDVDAMQARIDELKQSAPSVEATIPDQSNAGDSQAEASQAGQQNESTQVDTDYSSWTVPQIKELLASKEIGFKASASKDELLALIPKG